MDRKELLLRSLGFFIGEKPIYFSGSFVSNRPFNKAVRLCNALDKSASGASELASQKAVSARPPFNSRASASWSVLTGLGIGVAFGSAAAGWVIDGFGSHAGFMVAIVAGVLAMLIAGLGYRSLRSAHIRAISRAEEAVVKHG